MTDPLTTATRLRDALTAYIEAAEALPAEIRALLLDDGGHWTGVAVASAPVVRERPDIVKPYRAEMWTEWHDGSIGSWVPRSTSKHLKSAKASARGYLSMDAYTNARIIDRRTKTVVWEWAKDVDPPTDNP